MVKKQREKDKKKAKENKRIYPSFSLNTKECNYCLGDVTRRRKIAIMTHKSQTGTQKYTKTHTFAKAYTDLNTYMLEHKLNLSRVKSAQ